MLHAPMDYLDCACFTGRTSIPIRCIVERVSSNGNVTSPSSPSTTVTPNVSSTPTPTLSPLSTTSTTTTTTSTTTSIAANSPIATSGSNLTTNSPNVSNALDLNGSSTLNTSITTTTNTESTSDSSQAISTQFLVSLSPSTTKTLTSPILQIHTESLITPSSSPPTTTATSLSTLSTAGDKSSGEAGESVDSKTTNDNVNHRNIVDQDNDNLDVNPANSNNINKTSNLINIKNNNSCNFNNTGNVVSNGDPSVNSTLGEKSINDSNISNSNQRHSNSSPSIDLTSNNIINSNNNTTLGGNNNGGGHCQTINTSSPQQQLSPTSTLRSLFGLNQYPFQSNHLHHNLSHLTHHHHHHNHNHPNHHSHSHHQNLLNSQLDHSSTNLNQQSGDSGNHSSGSQATFPASISPSGTVEQDSFAIITSGLLFSNLVKTALLHLGYSTSEISGAKGFIQLRNWKPLTLDQITDSVDATVGDIMGDISSIASLRIILNRPRTSGPNEIEDKLLQVLLAQSYSLLANSGSSVDQTLLAALMGRNNRPGLEAELNEETRGKFDQWYMQQVFNQYRQMATLAAAQAHHQQAAAAAAAVMAATSQQQKHQAAAAALAAAVNAAAVSAGTASSVGGGSVDGSVVNDSLSRTRGAAAAAAAAAAAVAAAANCQSLLNLDLDAVSLASNASASAHSNHLKDNHHSSKHHQMDNHYHSRGPSTLASSSSSHLPLLSAGRSSDANSGGSGSTTGGGGTGRLEGGSSTSSNISSGTNNTNVNASNNNGSSNNSINRTSPNAPGQYVRTRIRTSFDPEMELPKLHKWFSENQHPTRAQIQQYVKELNSLESRRGRKPLDVNNVVYWFKNARAAHKRHELKLVNGSQSPTLSNNHNVNNSSNLLNNSSLVHCRDPYDGRITLGSRSGRGLGSGLIPGLIGDRFSGLSSLTGGSIGSGVGGNGASGNDPYADSNGNEDLLMSQMYDDDGSEAGQDDYDGDDMMMDDDCSSQISQTLDLSVRPMKRQRSDSSPPGSPISGPSSLSDLIRGTPPHTLASASSCHSNFNVKDEPPSDDEDEDDYDDMDERDYYPVPTSRHGLSLTSGGNHGGSSISSRSSNDPHNLSTSNYLGLGSESINGILGETGGGRHHHSSSSSSHDRHHHQSSSLNNGGSSGGQPDSPEEGRRIRRSRTFIDPTTEVPKLEQWFSLCTHPTHPQIVQYTDELNSSPYRLKYPKLEPKNIQFWFKNRRAKSKRQNLPISSSNTSPLTTGASGTTSTSSPATTNNTTSNNNNPPSSASSSSSSISGPLAPVTTTSSSSSSSLSPSIASNCSVSSLSLATSTGPVATSVSSSALTIDRLIGH